MNRKERRAQKKKEPKHKPAPQPSAPATQLVTEQELNTAKNLIDGGNYADGTMALLQVIKKDPTNIQALEYMALAAERIGSYDSALNMFLSIKKAFPQRKSIDLYIGHMLFKLDRIDEALEYLLPLTESDPDNFKPKFLVGLQYLFLGDVDKMEHYFNQVLKINPVHIETLYNYVSNKKVVKDKDHPIFKTLKDLEKTYNQGKITDPKDAQLLHFALYNVYENLKEYDKAFDYLNKANSLKRQQLKYDTDEAKEYFSLIKSYFSKERMETSLEDSHPSELPVFIVGMPRSGTTLLEQILHSHPHIEGIGENPALDNLIRLYSYLPPLNDTKYPLRTNQNPNEILTTGQIAEKYVNYIIKECPSAKRIVNKSITNFHWLGFLALIYPNARFIDLRRNPMDSCLSTYSKNFNGESQSFAYNLSELGEYYVEYLSLMVHWNSLLEDRILSISYEEIVNDTEGQARRVIDFLGLEWDEKCLKFYEADKKVRTASAAQVRKPIYKEAMERWRRYETPLIPLIQALGDAAPENARELIKNT